MKSFGFSLQLNVVLLILIYNQNCVNSTTLVKAYNRSQTQSAPPSLWQKHPAHVPAKVSALLSQPHEVLTSVDLSALGLQLHGRYFPIASLKMT